MVRSELKRRGAKGHQAFVPRYSLRKLPPVADRGGMRYPPPVGCGVRGGVLRGKDTLPQLGVCFSYHHLTGKASRIQEQHGMYRRYH